MGRSSPFLRLLTLEDLEKTLNGKFVWTYIIFSQDSGSLINLLGETGQKRHDKSSFANFSSESEKKIVEIFSPGKDKLMDRQRERRDHTEKKLNTKEEANSDKWRKRLLNGVRTDQSRPERMPQENTPGSRDRPVYRDARLEQAKQHQRAYRRDSSLMPNLSASPSSWSRRQGSSVTPELNDSHSTASELGERKGGKTTQAGTYARDKMSSEEKELLNGYWRESKRNKEFTSEQTDAFNKYTNLKREFYRSQTTQHNESETTSVARWRASSIDVVKEGQHGVTHRAWSNSDTTTQAMME